MRAGRLEVGRIATADGMEVDAVRAGEKIGSITITGDADAVLQQMSARVSRWNETLDQNARP